MTVWIVEQGAYEDRRLVGAYASAEAAIAANPPTRILPDDFKWSASYAGRPGGWRQNVDGSWYNGLDWDDAASCYPMEVAGLTTAQPT